MQGSSCCRCETYFANREGCDISVYYNEDGFFGLVGGYYSCIDLYEYRFVDDFKSLSELYKRFPYFQGHLTKKKLSNIYGGDNDMICDKCFVKMIWYGEVRFWGDEDSEMSYPGMYPYITDCCGKIIETKECNVYKLWTQSCFPYEKCYILSDMKVRDQVDNILTFDALFVNNYVWYFKQKKNWMKERAIICNECVPWDETESVRSNYENGSFKIEHKWKVDKNRFNYFLKDLIWKQFHVRQLRIISSTCMRLPKDIQKLILSHLVKLVEYPLGIKSRIEYICLQLSRTRKYRHVCGGDNMLIDSHGILYDDTLCVRYIQPSICKYCKEYVGNDGQMESCNKKHYKSKDGLHTLYHESLYESKCEKDGILFSFDEEFERKFE